MGTVNYPQTVRCRECRAHYVKQRYHDVCPQCHEGKPCGECGQVMYVCWDKLKRCWECTERHRKKPRHVHIPLPPDRVLSNLFEERGSQEERERRAALWGRLQAKRRHL